MTQAIETRNNEIRAAYESGEPVFALAASYDMPRWRIRQICGLVSKGSRY